MVRFFVIEEREFPDPDPKLTIEQVRDSFAEFLPELHQATHTVVQRGEDQLIDFSRTVGTKGLELFARDHQHEPQAMLRDLAKLYMMSYTMTFLEAKLRIINDLAALDQELRAGAAAARATPHDPR